MCIRGKGDTGELFDVERNFRSKCSSGNEQSTPSSLLESIFEDYAYEDRAFPIAADQTISHPSTVAEQTQLLRVKEQEKVLEIGTGSGYQTAVLIEMKAFVYTIERQKIFTIFQKENYGK